MLNLNAAHRTALRMNDLLSLDELRYQSRAASMIIALQENDQRSAPDAYPGNVAQYRLMGWELSGGSFFKNHLIEYPVSGGAAHIWDEAIRDNLRFDDARHRAAGTPAPLELELTPESIVAGTLSEDKARDGRRKLRELIEAKNAAELALKTQARELEIWKNQAKYNEGADVASLDATDTRTWHLFAEAARIAEREEYCSEYDRIAELGGVPTRDQLRDHGLLATAGRVAVSISFVVYVDVDDIEDPEIDQSTIDDLAIEFIKTDLDSNNWEVAD